MTAYEVSECVGSRLARLVFEEFSLGVFRLSLAMPQRLWHRWPSYEDGDYSPPGNFALPLGASPAFPAISYVYIDLGCVPRTQSGTVSEPDYEGIDLGDVSFLLGDMRSFAQGDPPCAHDGGDGANFDDSFDDDPPACLRLIEDPPASSRDAPDPMQKLKQRSKVPVHRGGTRLQRKKQARLRWLAAAEAPPGVSPRCSLPGPLEFLPVIPEDGIAQRFSHIEELIIDYGDEDGCSAGSSESGLTRGEEDTTDSLTGLRWTRWWSSQQLGWLQVPAYVSGVSPPHAELMPSHY